MDQERYRADLEDIASLADRIEADIKEIAHGLRPQHIDKIGLAKSITQLIHEVSGAYDVHFTMDIAPIDDTFEDDRRIHVYRIVQECVSNIVKHSNARRARLSISRRNQVVEIRVEDNGQGFKPERLESSSAGRRTFGLMGLKERARMLGGTIDIRSTPGAGTAIVVKLPFDEQTHA